MRGYSFSRTIFNAGLIEKVEEALRFKQGVEKLLRLLMRR